MSKIGFIITTMLRDELLRKSVESLLKYKQDNREIIVIDQGEITIEKRDWLKEKNVHYYPISFDSGLSFSRNYGVQIAKQKNCDYVVIGSDSFLFNESIQKINTIVDLLNSSNYSFCGFSLDNCICGWEGKINLIEGQAFELDFVDKKKPHYILNKIPFWKIEICRNFFIAKIDILLNVQWDENLKLREHEDEFMRIKQAGYRGLWTDYIIAEKMTDRPNKYKQLRNKNMQEGLIYLQKKWNIKNWIKYKKFNNAK